MNFWPLSLMAVHSPQINDLDPQLRAGAGHMKNNKSAAARYWTSAGLFVNLQASWGESFTQETKKVLARDPLRPVQQQRYWARGLGAAKVRCNLLQQYHGRAAVR